ncbi:MAG: S8 family peptidase, partial [Gammaproteobacteria bacterium]
MPAPRGRGATPFLRACLVPLLLAGCGGDGGSSGGGGNGGGGSGGGGSTPGGDTELSAYYRSLPPPGPQASGPDPLLPSQWHLDNTGQDGGVAGQDLRAFPVWGGGDKGNSVRVAIIDDAVETVHRDLAPNLAPGATWDYRAGAAPGAAPLPATNEDDHGTAVTGIIVARDDNALGGAGVAPRAQFSAYNALATETNADVADALNRDLANNAIYNNSWGAPDNGNLRAAASTFVAAVRNGVATGRGGLGAIYVFPAGNGGCYLQDSSTGACQVDNSNYDGYANQFGVMAVCAFDDEGRAPFYAEPGANVLLCGPSGGGRAAITTTALKDSYRSDFSGTSASTPMVSGVAALILAARPDLSWRDVRLILAYSARRIDPGNPGWTSGPVGRPFNPFYGFGGVDAQAALALARGWQTVGDSASLQSCGPYAHG